MKEEELYNLIRNAHDLLNDNKEDEAEIQINKVLKEYPLNLDAHLLLGYCGEFGSEKSIENFKFVLDNDMNYQQYLRIQKRPYGFIVEFLSGLELKAHRTNDPEQERKILDEIVDYSLRLLREGRGVFDYYQLSDALLETGHYREVINIGLYLAGKKSAEEVGMPGLASMKNDEAIYEIADNITEAFFLLNKYEEGSEWIYEVLVKNEDDSNYWRLFGIFLCTLGYPEECVRAWIIAIEYGFEAEKIGSDMESVASVVCDSKYPDKMDLYSRLIGLKDKIPQDKKIIFEDIKRSIIDSIHDKEIASPDIYYIESKLEMKLPGSKHKKYVYSRDLIYIPKQKSNHPIFKKMKTLIDNNIDKRADKSQKDDLENKIKEKVTIGTGQTPGQEGLTLAQFGIDITALADNNEIPPVIGRDKEIEQMIRILVRFEKNNPVLLGEAGVGKTAVVQGLAQRIIRGEVPKLLLNKRIVELNVGVLVAGTTYRGDFEKRINDIIKDVQSNPDVILFIDELHTLVGAGGAGRSLDASNILKPALAGGELRLIGATTVNEFSRSIEKDPALERRFSTVWVNEIDQEQTLNVLKARRVKWQEHHHVKINDEVLLYAIQSADKHIRSRHFPDKAIDLIDEACSLAQISSVKETGNVPLESTVLTIEHVKEVMDKWTGSSEVKSTLPDKSYFDDIRLQLKKSLIGHDSLLEDLSIFILDEKLGLHQTNCPRLLYFYGWPDTGKAECAEALSRILWSEEKGRFLSINMGLYKDEYAITRFTGHADSEKVGILGMQLKYNPYSVIYLHNFHLAHPRIMSFFNNLFSEGYFIDSNGQSIFVKNAIFILGMTVTEESNNMGFINSGSNNKMEIKSYLEKYNIPKQLIESIHQSFWFDALDDKSLKKLIELKLNEIKKQPYISDFDITYDDKFIDDLIKKYTGTPSSYRNLGSLFNKYVYPYILRIMK